MKIDTTLIPYDMPAVHVLILALLADAPEQTLSRGDLEDALQCNAYHAGTMLRPLKEQGFIDASPNQDAWGNPHISLTNAGQVFLDRVEVR